MPFTLHESLHHMNLIFRIMYQRISGRTKVLTGRIKCTAGILIAGILCSHCSTNDAVEEVDGFRVPPGFEITQFADQTMVHDIFKMTLDPKGRVVISGSNYIKVLEDTNGDGRADQISNVSDFPEEGARGMYIDGDTLITTGNRGVVRMLLNDRNDSSGEFDDSEKKDHTGEAEISVEKRRLLLTHHGSSEHSVNSVLKGPDGWFYLIASDRSRIEADQISLPGSPVKNPVQGTLMRFSSDGGSTEVLAHGFRNPYDMAFNAFGHIFVYDSDGERMEYIPGYVPSRVYDVGQGMLHRWIFHGGQYWNAPSWFFDHTEQLAVIGRGSPTGVVVYRHRQFPERYRDGLFLADWSYGRIYFISPERHGSTYRGEPEVFLQATGNQGFAITSMEVGPEGDIFVTIGGRGTSGGIYRIRYTGTDIPLTQPTRPLQRVLRADQPLSSWSRAVWVPAARSLGHEVFESAALDENLSVRERIRALEVLVEVFGAVPVDIVIKLTSDSDSDAELVARSAWALSRNAAAGVQNDNGHRIRTVLAQMTHNNDPRIVRAAWEAIGTLPYLEAHIDPEPAWLRGFNSNEQRIRMATAQVARGAGYDNFLSTIDASVTSGPAGSPDHNFDITAPGSPGGENDKLTPLQWLGFLYVVGPDHFGENDKRNTWLTLATRVFEQASDNKTRIDALRLIQIGLGDILLIRGEPGVDNGYEGAETGRTDPITRRNVARSLASNFPDNNRIVNLETARVMAMLEESPAGFHEKLATRWTPASPVVDDLHYLLAFMRLPGSRSTTATNESARALVGLQIKMKEAGYEPSRFWPGRVSDMLERLIENDPSMAEAVISQSKFRLADHALIANVLPEPHRTKAARILLEAAIKRETRNEQALTPELVNLISILPPDSFLPLLRRHREDVRIRESIITVLADHADSEDRDFLVESLNSRNGSVVEQASRALTRLKKQASDQEWITGLEALKRFTRFPEEEEASRSLSQLLRHWANEPESVISLESDPAEIYRIWVDRLTERRPETVAQLSDDNERETNLDEQLSMVNWETGSVQNGERIFSERACRNCHTGTARLGPALNDITGRFSPEDLMRIINNPGQINRDTYQAMTIRTTNGRTHTGIMIYDSPAVHILQRRDGSTINISGEQVLEIRESTQSLMPEGLLENLTPQEIADLHAYLSTQ